MLTLDEYKDKVVEICEQLGSGLPYEPEDVKAEDWQELAGGLADLARFVGGMANRLASYAGNASKRAVSE